MRHIRPSVGQRPPRPAGPRRGKPSQCAFRPCKQSCQRRRASASLLQLRHDQVLLEHALRPSPVVQDELQLLGRPASDPLRPRIGVFTGSMESDSVLLEYLLQHWVHAGPPKRHRQARHGQIRLLAARSGSVGEVRLRYRVRHWNYAALHETYLPWRPRGGLDLAQVGGAGTRPGSCLVVSSFSGTAEVAFLLFTSWRREI